MYCKEKKSDDDVIRLSQLQTKSDEYQTHSCIYLEAQNLILLQAVSEYRINSPLIRQLFPMDGKQLYVALTDFCLCL